MKFIIGKHYQIHGQDFIYDGVWNGYNCDKCGKVRNVITFVQNDNNGNPTQVTKYGTECIKSIDIK